jgi:hypothetical protein
MILRSINFFQLLSKLNNLNYEEMHELIIIENQQKVISRISENIFLATL